MDETGLSFGVAADAYDRGRPEWPEQLLDSLPLGPEAEVLDLAAGTGKLTRLLARRFARVVAVEPDEAMRALIHVGEPLAGRAEAIPLVDGAVDAVFVAEAFHWFDYERALAEIRRVLRPGGGLAVLARGWGEIPPPLKADLDEVWARYHPAQRSFPDWRDHVRPQGPEQFVDTLPISGRDLVDLWLTGSTPASIPEDERRAIAARAYPALEGSHELELTTEVYWTTP